MGSRSTPLRVDLRRGKPPLRPTPLSRRAFWTWVIGGAAALFVLNAALERAWPGAGVALDLALRWVLAGVSVASMAAVWRIPGTGAGWRWRLPMLALSVFLVARAGWETYAALR